MEVTFSASYHVRPVFAADHLADLAFQKSFGREQLEHQGDVATFHGLTTSQELVAENRFHVFLPNAQFAGPRLPPLLSNA